MPPASGSRGNSDIGRPMNVRHAPRALPTALGALLVVASIMAAVATPALGQQKAARKGDRPVAGPVAANIDRNGVLILVRGTLLALDHANKTGNYTVLRDLGAPGFQVNSAADLARIFSSHREQKLDLGGLAVLEPQLTLLPQVEPSGMLHIGGFFPSVPTQVNFELLFAPVDRKWKLFGLSLDLTEGGPRAPEAPADPPPPEDAGPPEPPTASVRPESTTNGAVR